MCWQPTSPAPLWPLQQVLHGMMNERWGRIINITSVVGEAGNPGQANYVASKAGLIGLTKSLAQEMASRNVTVNAIAPGFIDTDMTAGLPQEWKDKLLAAIPLEPSRQARRRRCRRSFPRQRRSRLHHRSRPQCQRRHVYVGCRGRPTTQTSIARPPWCARPECRSAPSDPRAADHARVPPGPQVSPP